MPKKAKPLLTHNIKSDFVRLILPHYLKYSTADSNSFIS